PLRGTFSPRRGEKALELESPSPRAAGRGWRAAPGEGRARASLEPLGRPDQLFGIHLLAILWRAIFIVVRDHQAIALKVAGAGHRSFHHHADPFAEHLRRCAGRLHVHGRLLIGYVEVERRYAVEHTHRAGCDLPSESDRRAVSLVACVAQIARRPVVDEIAADAAAGEDCEPDRRRAEGQDQEKARALHVRFSRFRRTNSETAYAVSTSAVQPYAAHTKPHPPVM